MSRNMSASNGESSSELPIGLRCPMTDNDVRQRGETKLGWVRGLHAREQQFGASSHR